jgi:hypothetical protein
VLLVRVPAAVPEALLDRMSVTNNERELLSGVAGRDLVEVACGQLRTRPDEPAVSAPMLSAAPGVLLAAEIVKGRTGCVGPLSPSANTLRASILKGPHRTMVFQHEKRAGCECNEELYREFFRRKWDCARR